MSNLGDVRNHQIEQMRNAFIDARIALVTRYGFDPDKDARLTVFNKCTHVLGSVQLGWVFLIHHLTSHAWWGEKCKMQVAKKTMQKSVSEFEMFLFIGFIQFIFASIESSIRVYVRTLDPLACSGGTAEFKSVYEWLLKRLNLQQYSPLLDLVRNIRNSLHNNGLFLPKSGKNEIITYKDKSYTFEIGKPNNFVTWDLMVTLMPDIITMLVDIVESEEISSKPRIDEPS